MDLSVPVGMSPMWRGITVWQLAHRQIWWEPRWRTGSQPRWRRMRTNLRALTVPVYQARRDGVYGVRRRLVGGVVGRVEVRVVAGVEVSLGAGDGQAEEVAEAAEVAAGGEQLVEDTVLSHVLGHAGEAEADPIRPGGAGAQGVALMEEQVGVGGCGPAPGAVVEIDAQALSDSLCEHDDPAGDLEPTVAYADQGDGGQLGGREGVEPGQCGRGGVWGADTPRSITRCWRQEWLLGAPANEEVDGQLVRPGAVDVPM